MVLVDFDLGGYYPIKIFKTQRFLKSIPCWNRIVELVEVGWNSEDYKLYIAAFLGSDFCDLYIRNDHHPYHLPMEWSETNCELEKPEKYGRRMYYDLMIIMFPRSASQTHIIQTNVLNSEKYRSMIHG
ncbi:hypothetical protein K8T06_16300 [bacterium]|nr:hypothetical protein [bacterium]